LIEPIIIIDPSDDSKILSEPLRGPVLIIRRYDDFNEITQKLAARKDINNLYYFGKNLKQRADILHKFKKSHIHLNECGLNVYNSHLPEGSIGGVFNGKIGGQYGFKAFSQSRIVMETKGLRGYKGLIPPLTPEKSKAFHKFDFLKRITVRQARVTALGLGVFFGYKYFF